MNKKCINCGNPINQTDNFCTACGTKIPVATERKCNKCGNIPNTGDNFCTQCGSQFNDNNITITNKKIVLPSQFDSMYDLSEDKLLEEFIKRELIKAGINPDEKQIPSEVLNRQKKLNIIFASLLFIFVSMIFFHFPIITYVIGLIILIPLCIISRKYNLIKYLKKQIKARPAEKITNIVITVKNSFVTDNSRNLTIVSITLAIVLPLLIFISPRIIYEKNPTSYSVRFYTFGLTNFTKATIPESYKGKPVTSLRGNTFSNMPFLKEVTLPNTITEIRGQAFKNDISLTTVNIPNRLEYLGGGSFYNCFAIKSIELPDTLTYMGGEAFYQAVSLQNIKLSKNLTEIRGNSFENCTSLQTIVIPDKVTRIGGHAFYGASSLSKVTFTSKSRLQEIGSSAFRQCPNLYNITIPINTYVNERAFKESPTTIKYFGNYNYNYSNYYN